MPLAPDPGVVAPSATIDVPSAYSEFLRLKLANSQRNDEYYLLREAVKGNFRWPAQWPQHIEKMSRNSCKALVDLLAAYIMGKGFTWNLDRPNTLEFRDRAERTEKILQRLLDSSQSTRQFASGARSTAMLGRTVYKVYRDGKKGAERACFSLCQPDYFYGIPSGDGLLNDYATVYYSYPIDRSTANAMYGTQKYQTEAELSRGNFYDVKPEDQRNDIGRASARRIPVLEVWTKTSYARIVGGITIFNGANPFKWSDSGEGFIPFVVIDNNKDVGSEHGQSDIGQVRTLNEKYNYALSRENYIVSRWLQPTLVWEGAPQNYAEVLAGTVGGGGVIPARLGARLYFLSYDRSEPAVQTLIASLREAMLETAGMTEIAMQGLVSGTVNTGPALGARFQPLLARIESKRREWEVGLEQLFAMLLQVQEDIGDSRVLGEAVVGATTKSEENPTGELVPLSGKDIEGLRGVKIEWPNVLPKDDAQGQSFMLELLKAGGQSFYTTLEKLGFEYPDDEIERIREENMDPSLRGEKVAEQMKAAAPMIAAQGQGQAPPDPEDEQMNEALVPGSGQDPSQGMPPDMQEQQALAQGNPGARIRALRRNMPQMGQGDNGEPVIRSGSPDVAGQ